MAIGLAWLIGFSLYFYTRPMPNLHATFAETRREAWQLTPYVLIDWLLPAGSPATDTNSANVVESGWEFLPERLVLWSWAGMILAGGWGIGSWLLRFLVSETLLTGLERFVFALGLGLSLVSLMTLGLGLAGMLHRGLFLGILSLATLGGMAGWLWDYKMTRKTNSETVPHAPWNKRWVCLLAILPFFVAMLLGGVSPSTDFDVKEYHFGGPKEFYLAGQVQFLEHNVYTSFPFLTEMLTLVGMVLKQDVYAGALVGKTVLMLFIPLTGLAILAAGRRWFGEAAGWLGMLVWLTTPWATRIAIIAYAEGGLTCYLFLACFAAGIALTGYQSNRLPRGLFFLAGLLAGSAMACKYTGLVSSVFPLAVSLGFVHWRMAGRRAILNRVLPTLGAFSLGVLVTVGPWLAKNLAETGNPVYPLAWSVFGGKDWDAELNAQWSRAHSPPHHRLSSLLILDNGSPGWLIDVSAINDWLSPLLYGFAPLVLLIPVQRKTARWFWLYAAWLFFSWWAFTHRLDRFWVPMLPLIALLAGAGAVWSTDRVWKIVSISTIGLALVFNLVLIGTQNAGYIAWLSNLDQATEFAARLTAPEIVALNQLSTGSGERIRVLSVGEAEVFDARFPIVYNTVFDRSIFQTWTEDERSELPPAERPMKSPAEIREKLRQEGITHILVNWQEILRYRPTYGYADYVQPQRFLDLVNQGVLESAIILNQRPWEELPVSDRKEILKSGWRDSLMNQATLRDQMILAALYRVR